MGKRGFRCVKCGLCCREEGFVYLSVKEARSVSKFLGIPYNSFRKRYTRKFGKSIVFRNSMKESCPFLVKGSCSIYGVRPEQCRTFPVWTDNYKDPKEYCTALIKATSGEGA